MLRTGTDAYSGVLDKRGIRAADDMVVMPLQCGTQWDGLGHIFYENYMWNGYDCREVTSFGAQKCGIEKTKEKLVGRGVFLDVPRALGKQELEDGYAITNDDLDKTAKVQGVKVKRGDHVVVRTGHMERCLAAGSWDGYSGGDAPRTFIRDDRLGSAQSDRGDGQRHLGLRGASERSEGRREHQPALALDHHPDHGNDHGRDFLRGRPCQGLRRRQGLRIHVRCARDPDHRRRRLANKSTGDQVKATPGHNAKRTGAEVLADMLAGYGVTHVFMVPAVLRRSFAEMERRTKIARIHTHGEKSAAYMADGYARASGKPGVCMAQVIGALNLAAGLRDACLAHSPVIAMTGGRDAKTKFRKVYQEIDDMPAFEPVTKFNATIDDVARFPDMVRQAFRVAVSGTPGPVHLQFRGNEGQVDQEEAEMEALVEAQFARVPPFRPEPEAARVTAALKLLQQAERPVLVAGGGVRASGAGAELIALAEALQIPVATSLNGKDSIPGNHPLSVGVVGSYSRESANRVVGQADLVCFIGTETGGMTTHFWAVPKIGTPAIQIDIDAEALGRNYPLAAAVLGDAKVTLARMVAQADRTSATRRQKWVGQAAALCKEWYEKYKPMLQSDAVPINPGRICHELTQHLPDDAIVVVDTGHAGMWMGGIYDLRSVSQSYMRSAGHLGWAFPAGIGAKCACPDRPVVVFTGDAGFWYHIAEVETAVRWNINTITVVNNNSSGNQSKRGFDRAYGGEQTAQARELWTYSRVNFARIAEEMGAVGIRVEQPGDIAPALARALAANRPVVIDVVTDIDALAPTAVG